MRGKIFRSIWLSLLATLTITLGLTIALMYSHFTSEQLDQLRNETKLVSQAVNRFPHHLDHVRRDHSV